MSNPTPKKGNSTSDMYEWKIFQFDNKVTHEQADKFITGRGFAWVQSNDEPVNDEPEPIFSESKQKRPGYFKALGRKWIGPTPKQPESSDYWAHHTCTTACSHLRPDSSDDWLDTIFGLMLITEEGMNNAKAAILKHEAAEKLKLLDAVAERVIPKNINYHEAIGDVIGHNDIEMENFDKGYNKANRTMQLELARLRKEVEG